MEEYQYLICYAIDPVEFGFSCPKSLKHKEFKGFNAFNQYFDMLKPEKDIDTIPDVWVGYYRIAFVQFNTHMKPEQLRENLKSFHPKVCNFDSSEALFQTWKLDVAPQVFRLGNDFNSEPIALYITHSSEFRIVEILEAVKKRIEVTDWIEIPKRRLHMNIRLYSNYDKATNERKWTWKEIKQIDIPKEVNQYPIEFFQGTLQIIPSRGVCTKLYDNGNHNQWWLGVTELDGQCSDCQAPIENGKWNGVCMTCRQYERIKPVWSLPYLRKTNDSNDIQTVQVKNEVSDGVDALSSECESKLNLSENKKIS